MMQLIWPLVIGFVVTAASGPLILPLLVRLKFGQNIRDDGPKSHLIKAGTPTMGGIIMMAGLAVAAYIMARGSFTWITFAVLITVGFCGIGFLDDYIKVYKSRSLGLKAYQKIIGQTGLSFIIALFGYNQPEIGTAIFVPVLNVYFDLGVFYIPFTMFVVIAAVNAVNLTDGLDGLAASMTVIAAAAFSIIAFGLAQSAAAMGDTLRAIHLNNTAVFGSATSGACLGFLRFNSYPAKVFMGDTGSLALGGVLSVLCVLTRMELLLPVIGGMFVMSVLTSIIQVISYKLRGKRVFLMAPLHHHFELKGMHETRVVALYIIVTVLLSLLAFLLVAY